MAAPVNDLFADAIPVVITTPGGAYASAAISTAEGTFEPGEPQPTGYGIGTSSIWWKYTPVESGTATFDTTQSNGGAGGDTEMAVYTGSSVDALTNVGAASDNGPNLSSIVTISVTAGVTYYIQVGGYAGQVHSIVLSVQGPVTVVGGGGSSGISDPRDIPGLLVWCSAEAQVGYVDGANMTHWTDLSGNGNHLAAGSLAATAPKWYSTGGASGGPVVDLFGASYFDVPQAIGLSAAEAMLTVKPQAATGGHWDMGASTESSHYLYYGTIYDDFGTTTRREVGTSSSGVWQRYRARTKAGGWTAWVNGVQKFNTATNTVGWPASPRIGLGMSGSTPYSLDAPCGLFLLYGRELTSTERTDLEAWAAAHPSGGFPAAPAGDQTISLGRAQSDSVARIVPPARLDPPASIPWHGATVAFDGERWQKAAPLTGAFPQVALMRRVLTSSRIARSIAPGIAARVVQLGRVISTRTPGVFSVLAQEPLDYYPTEVLQDAPLVYWRFEEGPDAIDYSGNGRTGYFGAWLDDNEQPGVTQMVPGAIGQGQRFDYHNVEYGDADDYSLTTDFTLELWLQTDLTLPPRTTGFVNVGSGQKIIGMQVVSGVGYLYGRWGQGTGSTRTNVAAWTLVNDGAWHHLVLTRTGGSVRFYVDNVQTYAADAESAYTPSSWPGIVVGAYDPLPGDPPTPAYDEVAYYNYGLTPTQVKRHYDSAIELGSPPVHKIQPIGRATATRLAKPVLAAQDQVVPIGRASRVQAARPLGADLGLPPGAPRIIPFAAASRTSIPRAIASYLRFNQAVPIGRAVRASAPRALTYASGVIFADSFDRPDGQVGTPESGGPYAFPFSDPNNIRVQSGALHASIGSGTTIVTWPAAADFDTSFVLRTIGSGAVPTSFVFRFVSTTAHWKLDWTATQIRLGRRVGSPMILAAAPYAAPIEPGSTIRVVARGKIITVHLNGRPILQAEDQYLQAGTQGFYFGENVTRIDSISTRSLVPLEATTFDDIEIELTLILSASDRDGFIFKGRDSRRADEGLMA